MSLAELLRAVPAEPGPMTVPNAEAWLQGRTLYGGVSALIAYRAARAAFPDAPPLRAAQIAFVGPLGAELEVRRVLVRAGRNVTQIRSELWSEGACALTAFWLFGAARAANAEHAGAGPVPMPAPPPAEPDAAGELRTEGAPAFIGHNFELRRAQGRGGDGGPVVRRWARLRERGALEPVEELVLMGDVLPPGAMRAMARPGPISSVNWSFNVLATAPATREGWWLSENASQHAAEGYSAERLRLWNADGVPVMDGIQCVAIFG